MADKCIISIHGSPSMGYQYDVEVRSPGRPDRRYIYFHQDGLMEAKISDLRKYRSFKAWALLREKAKFITKITNYPLETAAARHEQLTFDFTNEQQS